MTEQPGPRIPAEDSARVYDRALAGDPVASAWMVEHYAEAEAATMGIT